MYEDNIRTTDGERVLTYGHIEALRRRDKGRNNPLCIIAQKGAQENNLAKDVDILITGGNRGGAKGQPYDAPVATPFGMREMGKLKVGDIITDAGGRMQKVICITELGPREVYKLNFSDGTSVECTTDHLWKVKNTNHHTKSRMLANGTIEDDWRLWTFDMIREHFDKAERGEINRNYNINLVVPLCGEVRFTMSMPRRYKPSTSPYVIGALLGDGCMTEKAQLNRTASLTTEDEEIVCEFEKSGVMPFRVSDRYGSNARDYYFKDETLQRDLDGLGLSGKCSLDKFIPDHLKYAPVERRWELVQGLMDTDGTVDDRGHCSFTTVSRTLAEDMAFVLRSLGAYVTVGKYKAGYKSKDGEYVECNDAYTLYIKMEHTERLFRIKRKRERCRPYNGGVCVPTKRIVGYEFSRYAPCRCIAVSNPQALYLTSDFTVTHNSFTLLMEGLKDIYNPNFNAIILRNEKDDLEGIVKTSNELYSQLGKYNRSVNDMTWYFKNGGSLKFTYFSGSFDDFKVRFQGRQYSYIGIDEITHISYEKFKYLITNNRNAFRIRNRFWGTCNPDPDSWVRKFIDWWIGEDGLPIDERDGVVRYCFMDGNTVDSIYWGNTREEVYAQCREVIDALWKPEYEEMGFNKLDMFTKSVTFTRARLEDNRKLIESDPNYVSNLAQQDEEQRARDLEGNWNFKAVGDDIIKMQDMERFFAMPELTGGKRYASCDVAFEGGDSLVLWLWVGWHIQDIFVCRLDSKGSLSAVSAKLEEWGVLEENFTYDLNGLGQTFRGFFKRAVPFNNRAAVEEKYRYIYDNVKSQCAYLFAHKLIDGEISINHRILKRKFSGRGFENLELQKILMKERKCIRPAEDSADKGFSLIKKQDMKKVVGHSPDYIESLFMRMIFEIRKSGKHRPKGLLRYVNPINMR